MKSKLSGVRDSESHIDMKQFLRKAALPLLILILLSASIGFLLYGFHLIIGQTEQKGLADIRQILYELSSLQGDTQKKNIQDLVVQQSLLIDGRIIIIDMDSNLLADSRLGHQTISGKYFNAELSEAKVSDISSGFIRDKSLGTIQVTIARTFKTTSPLSISRKMVISVSYLQEEVHKFFLAFMVLSGIFLFIGTAIASLFLVSFSRQLRRPLRKLLQSTDSLAGGGIAKIRVDTNDEELEGLAGVFNSLVDKYNLLIESDNRKYSRINTLLSHLKSGFLMTDKKSQIIMLNPAAEKMLNLNKMGLFKIRNVPDQQSEVLHKISEAILEVNRTQNTVEFTQKTDEDFILEVSVEAVFNKYVPHEHSGVLVLLRDVTEAFYLEQLKDDFISNVSHELRTPLTLINGFVETLKSWEILSDEDRNTSLNIIEVETERLKKLINELLLLSKIEGDISRTVENTPIRIQEVLENVIALFESLRKEKSIVTEIAIETPLPEVIGVASWYRQIIFNIYHNALKYTPENGRVRISAQASPEEIIISISDNGRGIPEDDRAKIFDRFYRAEKYTNRKISGNGLGLTITKHMVNELGGTIDVCESEDGGAKFTVVLPLV